MHNYRLKHWLYLRVSAVVKPDDIVCVCLGGRGEGRVFKTVGSNIDCACMQFYMYSSSFMYLYYACLCLFGWSSYLAFYHRA